MSTLARKTWADLSRRRARTVLTIATLGLAIASLATLAVPSLMDRAMRREVAAARLHDVAVTIHDTALDRAQLDALAHLANVAGFDARVVYSTRVSRGGRSQHGVIWGLAFGAQPVDTVRLTGGQQPAEGQVLADAGDGSAASFPVGVGNHVTIGDRTLPVAGTARSLATSPSAFGSTDQVFYTDLATARSLAGTRGFNALAFRLSDDSSTAVTRTIAAIHGYLKAQTGREPFIDLPDIRGHGDWSGRSTFGQISALFYVITALAVLCALFLIANTTNTLVVEQAGEIAILKAIGGTRRQIAGVFVRTAALLGAAGALIGAGLGVIIAYLLTRFFATSIFNVAAGFAVSVPVIVVSLLAGPALAVAASLQGVAGYGTGRLDLLIARTRLLSGPARMGVRNVLRRKRRSLATVAQVALATGLALGLFAAGRSISQTTATIYGRFQYDIEVTATNGAPPLDAHARAIAADTPGVTSVSPVIENRARYHGSDYEAVGLQPLSPYEHQLRSGRWFTAADAAAHTPPVVLGPAAARTTHAAVGHTLTLDTAAGQTQVRVIGIDTGQWNNGQIVYFPLPVLQGLTGSGDATNTLWISTASHDHAAVDQATASVEDELAAAGYPVDTTKLYVQHADNNASNNQVLTVIEILGLLVVVITLIGLVSALTMAVIERTREIGILRCLGAKARDIRRVFSAEGITLAVLGWIIGIPVGWVISRELLAFVRHEFSVEITARFAVMSVPIALVAVVAVTVLVIRPPLRRASRIQPGAALRYQ